MHANLKVIGYMQAPVEFHLLICACKGCADDCTCKRGIRSRLVVNTFPPLHVRKTASEAEKGCETRCIALLRDEGGDATDG
jgi:hypothetical protein